MPAKPSPGKVLEVIYRYLNESRPLANRLHFLYSGPGNSVPDLITLASDFTSLWATNILPLIHESTVLTETSVTDLQSSTAGSAFDSVSIPGSLTGTALPVAAAMGASGIISRRYRGGHTRIYIPASEQENLQTTSTWKSTLVSALAAGLASYVEGVSLLTLSSYTGLHPVQVSWYAGATPFTGPTGRVRMINTLRAVPVVDLIEAFSADTRLWTQRKRLGKDLD